MSADFDALPRALQIRVDNAFDAALESKSSGKALSRKRRKLNPDNELTGGFVLESYDTRGGFTPHPVDEELEDHHPAEDDLIPYSYIPTALQILDLPPDDEEVLRVFRSAAGGWSNNMTFGDAFDTNKVEEPGGTVSRRDWRAVCAVVVGGAEDEAEGDGRGGGFVVDKKEDAFALEPIDFDAEEVDGEDEGGDDDAYHGSSLSSTSTQGADSDSDEYLAEPLSSKAKSKASNRKSKRGVAAISPGGPTPRQKQAALEAFSLFFSPSSHPMSDADVVAKRIMFKDIVRVADTLKEKIKADEITEMLALFSTSPDASVSFGDFTRMMIMAKLV